MDKINILSKYKEFEAIWSPHCIAELNDQQVLLAKINGEFVWHSHKDEDELFYVIKGKLNMEYRDKTVEVLPGEMIVVPKGVEHKPIANEEVSIMMFEPMTTLNTGEKENERTVKDLERI